MKKKFLIAGIIVAVIVLVVGGYQGMVMYSVYQKEKEREEKLQKFADIRQTGDTSSLYNEEGKVTIPVDFEGLQKENPDIYAWITIPGVVDEPILQHPQDNEYYQKHGAEGKKNKNGAVFTESLNHKDFSDSLTVIYGFNCDDGSLFGNIYQYRDRQFMKEHPMIYIYTPQEVYSYRIFAAYQSDNRHLLMRFNKGTYEGNVKAFIKDALRQREMGATVDRTVDIDTDNRFLTLSTHDMAGEEYRYLIQAYLEENKSR